MLLFGTSVGLDEAPLTSRLPALVSASPTVKPIGPIAVSSAVVWSPVCEIAGGVLFVEFTVNTNVSVAVDAPSLTVTAMVAAPNWPAPGVTVTVRLDPLRSEEHTSELQSLTNLVCRLLLEKKKT